MHVIRCLLVDDDVDDREIFNLALTEIEPSIEVAWAASGLEALTRLSGDDGKPDFIFLDLNMPGMRGTECLKSIKRLPAVEHVPVLIYSTSAHRKDIEETATLGAAHFLKKPSTIVALVMMLRDVFEGKVKSFYYEDGSGDS